MTDLQVAVESLSGGLNTVIYSTMRTGDVYSYPSFMVRLPLQYSTGVVPTADYGTGGEWTTYFPSHIVGDNTYNNVYVAKYPCVIIEGHALSLPLQAADVISSELTPANALEYVRRNGASNETNVGWHIMTALEAGYLANTARRSNTFPMGNISATEVTKASAVYVPDNDPTVKHTYVGSGDASWSTGITFPGVADLVGNYKEWVFGLKTDGYKLKFLSVYGTGDPVFDNSAALADSLFDDAYSYLVGNGASSSSSGAYTYGVANSKLTTTGGTTPGSGFYPFSTSVVAAQKSQKPLIALSLTKGDGSAKVVSSGYFTKGGDYTSGADGGLCAYEFVSDLAGCCFRSAYIDPEDIHTT